MCFFILFPWIYFLEMTGVFFDDEHQCKFRLVSDPHIASAQDSTVNIASVGEIIMFSTRTRAIQASMSAPLV
jgi:hypothetical protein